MDFSSVDEEPDESLGTETVQDIRRRSRYGDINRKRDIDERPGRETFRVVGRRSRRS